MKDKVANQQSEPCTKENKINFDYKAQFASYVPPRIDIVSLFKQTMGHKALKNPHTYESAKAELETYKSDEPNVTEKHTFIQKIDRSIEHDTLVTAVHELQRMFDKATIRSTSAQSRDNSPVALAAETVVDVCDKDRSANIEQQAAPNNKEVESEAKADLHVNETKDKSVASTDKEETGNNTTHEPFTVGNEKECTTINQDSAVKPKKTSRRGYTGKFAIAHMLHQGDFDTDRATVEWGSAEKIKPLEEVDEINGSTKVKNMNKEHKDKTYKGNNERSFDMLNDVNEVTLEARVSVEDKYRDLVLESQAVESLMKHKADLETEGKKRPERKVSFSSDEIVTEDSESDSSSDEESDCVDDQNDMHRQKTSANESNTYPRSYSRQNINTDRSRHISINKFEGARRKKEFRNEQVKFDNENYTNSKTKDYCYDNKESYDPNVPYNTGYAWNPYNFSQQSSTKYSQREHGIHPPQPQSMPGYPHAVYPSHRQHFYPGNFYSQWYPPFAQPFQQYPMQYSPYCYPTPPAYGSYSVPYANNGRPSERKCTISESEEEQNMKQAFELQNDYIRLMCQKGDKVGNGKKKHKRMS